MKNRKIKKVAKKAKKVKSTSKFKIGDKVKIIEGLAPRSLLSREEKKFLREEIQRCYDRWDECPEIVKFAKLEYTNHVNAHFTDTNLNWIDTFNVSTKMFKNLHDCKNYSLKELGID